MGIEDFLIKPTVRNKANSMANVEEANRQNVVAIMGLFMQK